MQSECFLYPVGTLMVFRIFAFCSAYLWISQLVIQK